MTTAEPTLLLTRPEPESRAFLNECEALAGRRLPAVISPLMEIQYRDEAPALDRYATIVFSSGNGVRAALRHASLTGRTVLTVGENTAGLARAAGAHATALGDNLDAFLGSSARIEGPVLVCRGVHTRGNLAEILRERGLTVDEAILYDQVALPLSGAARRLLDATGPVVAPLFSPRTAKLLSGQGVTRSALTVVAISPAVSDAWTGTGRVVVAEAPTSAAMSDLTVRQF